jgi:GNAT superfamily N-acetyltransferase
MSMELSFQPLTTEQWDGFVSLFGERGACGGCWCMLWRLSRKQFELQKGEGNKLAMKSIVESGTVPGILAYHKTNAIGWCAIASRTSFPALSRSRILRPIDDRPCWSVACLFVAKSYRKEGVSVRLLRAAAQYAKSQGAEEVEGYPVEPKSQKDMPPAFAWTGIAKAFIRAGFKEVARRSPTRPIMRLSTSPHPPPRKSHPEADKPKT